MIGRPRELTARALHEAVVAADPWRLELAALLENETAEAGAAKTIDAWAARMAEDTALADGFYRANLQTQMAGQLFVRTIEAPQAGVVALAADDQTEPFVRLPFDDAVDHFRSRVPVTPEDFAAMSDAERFRSFTMTKVVSERIRDKARELLAAAMTPDGPGLRDFIAAIRADEAALGFTPSSHGYLENVYRTATATSYNAGRYAAQTDPDVVAATGFWQYLTVEDDRVRDEHAALHGKTWAIGDPEAEQVYPPNSYQCRCVMVVLDPEDVDPRDMERRIDPSEAVTEGFRGTPAQSIEDEASEA